MIAKEFRNKIRRPRRWTVFALVGLLLTIAFSVTMGVSQAVGTAPTLGTAEYFAVLASSEVTNTGPTSITGDLGVSPGTAITGFPPGNITGVLLSAGAVPLQAQVDATTAYNNLASQGCDLTYGPVEDIGGTTIGPGVYCFPSSAGITGVLTLDSGGDPDAVWVFNIESTLITESGSSVIFSDNGNACNVFWRVGSSATLGTTTDFQGNIIAYSDISALTGATVSGRLLARNGAVTMDSNSINLPTNCVDDLEPGNIVTELQTNPDGSPTQFTFTSDYGSFDLGDGGSNDSGDLPPGAYDIGVTLPPGATLTSIVCVSDGDSTFTVDLPNNEVEVLLAAGDTMNCEFNIEEAPEEEPPPTEICLDGAADYQRTVILGKGMGNDYAHKNTVKLTIPNWQSVDELYGMLAGENNGAAKYVRFIYPNGSYEKVSALTSPAYRQWATFWYGTELNPAANIRGRWFLQASGKKNHIPRAFILYPTYHTSEPYVNVFDPLALDESSENHVYFDVAAGWHAEQQYRMAIPAPQQAVTIIVQVALVENNNDERPVNLTVSAEGATPQTVSPTGPSHGNLLNIVSFSLDIQAGTDEIVIDLVSPDMIGDSVSMVGTAAYYACEPTG
jgi:hypothetical protein